MPFTIERMLWSVVAGTVMGLVLSAMIYVSISYVALNNEIKQAKFEVETAGQLRGRAVRSYLNSTAKDVAFLAQNIQLIENFNALSRAWNDLGPNEIDTLRDSFEDQNEKPGDVPQDQFSPMTLYKAAHARLHKEAEQYVKRGGYEDLLMIGTHGNVLYSVNKDTFFTTNLLDGRYDRSSLATSFKQIKNSAGFVDQLFSDYRRSSEQNADNGAFIVSPIYSYGDTLLGAIALKLNGKRLSEIVNYEAGFLKDGGFYFFGDDYKLRGRPDVDSDSSAVKLNSFGKELIDDAFSGVVETREIERDTGYHAVVSFSSLTFKGVTWANIAELPMASIERRVDQLSAISMSLLGGGFIATLLMIFLIKHFLFSYRGMTSGDIERIKGSWGRLEGRQEQFAEALFENLFERDPSMRNLFRTSTDRQSKRFGQMLNHLIKNLDNFEKLKPQIQRMGRDHVEYGVQVHHFESFGKSFLAALKQADRKGLTRAERDSWADFFASVSQEMAVSMRQNQ